MEIRHEQINQLFTHAPSAILGNAILASIIIYIFFGNVPQSSLIIWGLIFFLNLFLRTLLWYKYKHSNQYTNPHSDVKKWLRLTQLGIFITGFLWGSSVYFADHFQLIDYRLMLTAIIFALAGGATATISIVFSVFLAFTLPMLLIIASSMFLSNIPTHFEAGLMILLGAVFIIYTAYQYNKNSYEKLVRTDELNQANKIISQQASSLELKVKERSEELLIARDEAIRNNQYKSEFLSNMSHELRTPLNAILGFAELLQYKADNLNQIQRDNVTEIFKAGNHLLGLINEVLDLSKVESGKIDIFMEKINLDEVLKQCFTLIQQQINEKNLHLIDNVSGNAFTIKADNTRIKQVLLNLLSNAIKYNKNFGEITLTYEQVSEQRLRINITDMGKGISAQDIPKLFSPFVRLNATADIEGTGIGLVITKKLTELMDGNIGVHSSVGKGSTFWIELPRA